MDFILQTWHLYLAVLTGWVNRQQQEPVDYPITENRVLKEKFGKKRILLNDDQRRRLAVKGWVLGRKQLHEVGTLFTLDAILRFARQNPTWGYDRIQGALAYIGYHISDSTVGNVLKAHGIEPAPDRGKSMKWSTFPKGHWAALAAIDFTTVEVWTNGGAGHLLPIVRHGT